MAEKWGAKAAAIPEFTELLERQDEACRKLLQWVKNYDVILCPASGKHGRAPINFGDDPLRRNPGRGYTGLYNNTGWPAARYCGAAPRPRACRSASR